MKIRHKQSGVELEGVRDSGPDFVEGASVIQPSSIYSKEHWEAVPEWVDVTGGCEWDGNMYLNDRARPLSPIVCDGNLYRLRKVSAVTLYPEGNAFIVERKA